MIRALDALESDQEKTPRREAFEMIQARFDGVSTEDHDQAAGLIVSLRDELQKTGGQP